MPASPSAAAPVVTAATLRARIDAALGRGEADLVVADARVPDLLTGEIARGDVAVVGDTIVGVGGAYRARRRIEAGGRHLVPGFVDAHCHVESSLIAPLEFDALVLRRGTTAAVWDPHEIANVLGAEGLTYALMGAERTAMDLRVALSSCVPATDLETSGARLEAADLAPHLGHPAVAGLAELMNFPGLLAGDPGLLAKLEMMAAGGGTGHVDGHAPLVGGTDLDAYLAAGVSTDHECTSAGEAREKLAKGARVFVREGSVSKDLAALAAVIGPRTAARMAFCTDDRNPLDIAEGGHIDGLIRMAIRLGAEPVDCYRMASLGAADAFGWRARGLVAPGQQADMVLLDDWETVAVADVVAAGRVVDDELFAARGEHPPVGLDSVHMPDVPPAAFAAPAAGPGGPVIGVRPGRIITDHLVMEAGYADGRRTASVERGIAKVAVIERHGRTGGSAGDGGLPNVGIGFVHGFDLARGAIASSVGHDSHNVTVVGMSDAEMALAVRRVRELSGGFVVVDGDRVVAEMALPIAGLMSLLPHAGVERALRPLREAAVALGCRLPEPFLQVGFLPLPVIPHLKITDRGLVDVDRFALVG